jgi:hypothetical protein
VSSLGLDARRRVRATWATLAGTDTFPAGPLHVVVNPESRICPRGWGGVVAVEDGILATAPDEAAADELTRVLAPLAPNDDWLTAFSHSAVLRGPAQLAYADRDVPRPAQAEDVERVDVGDDALVAFLQRSPAADRDEAGIGACSSPLAAIRVDGDIVAAAGYRVWLDELAHMSVLVDPRVRNRGLAMEVAAAATGDALARGFIAQWRARPLASRAIARRLGYVELGQQLSVQLR